MNVIIMSDLEGISGIDHISKIDGQSETGYAYACERLMVDLNAAIDGAYAGGAKKVFVIDGHGSGKNFIPGKLDMRAEQISISQWNELVRSKTIDAFMEVGAHAMPGTMNGFLDHAQSSKTWYNYFVNGQKCGELAQGALFIGYYDIPFVMVSGDLAACNEAQNLLGEIEFAVVKYGHGRNQAELVDLKEAEKRIWNAAKNSIKLVDKIKPLRFNMPLDIKLELTRSDYCDEIVERFNDAIRIDARCVQKNLTHIENYSDLLF